MLEGNHHQIRRWLRGPPLGAGAFGTVNLAIDLDTSAIFAVKSATSATSLQALHHEIEILQSVSGDNVVRCLGATHSDIFLEYMPGGSLSDSLKKSGGPLPLPEIRRFTRDVLLGLELLHQSGVIHGDIKGKNVLLSETGQAKLADFGSARFTQRGNSASGQFPVGTPLWMAPEVLLQAEHSTAADIWSLGCTVIEMITGLPPWRLQENNNFNAFAEFMQKLDKMVDDIHFPGQCPPLPENLPEDAVDFLQKCFVRQPEARSTATQLLQHPFIQNVDTSMRDLCVLGAESTATATAMAIASFKAPPMSPTSVLDDVSDYDSSLSAYRRSVPTLGSPSKSPADGTWITVRSPNPYASAAQRPLSDFMLSSPSTSTELPPPTPVSQVNFECVKLLRRRRRMDATYSPTVSGGSSSSLSSSRSTSPLSSAATSQPRQLSFSRDPP